MKPLLSLYFRARIPVRNYASLKSTRVSTVSAYARSFTSGHDYEVDEMGKEKEKTSFQLKVPKGTKDWEGKDMVIRDKIFGTITQVFKRHGAVTIDTYVKASSPL